jgi:menaquinone-9 beta-reductase
MVVEYDAIILGANYAGLAAAGELVGRRVLLLDRKPIGTGQTSACATLVETMVAVGTCDSLLQAHDTIEVCGFGHPISIDVSKHPFGVFDHATFCGGLRARGDAEFRQEDVRTVQGTEVVTSRGRYRARVVIEARGWRGAARMSRHDHSGYNIGIEAPLPIGARGLRLYIAHKRWGAGYAWAFPAGEETRFGICWFDRVGKLEPQLDDFLDGLGLQTGQYRHGGYFPWHQRPTTRDGRYVVGDAAGQCLALLGEGIRPAIYFGIAAGRYAASVLDGALVPNAGLRAYRRFAAAHDAGFRLFRLLQRMLPALPPNVVGPWLRLMTSEPQRSSALDRYARLFDVAALLAAPREAPIQNTVQIPGT